MTERIKMSAEKARGSDLLDRKQPEADMEIGLRLCIGRHLRSALPCFNIQILFLRKS